MNDEHEQPFFVTYAECLRIRRAYADGAFVGELTELFDRGNETVRRHLDGECSHVETVVEPPDDGTERNACPECESVVIYQRQQKSVGPNLNAPRFRCKRCEAEFDRPVTVTRRRHTGGNFNEAVKNWMAADPDEVFSE